MMRCAWVVCLCLMGPVLASAQGDMLTALAQANERATSGDVTGAEAAFARALEMAQTDEERAQVLSMLGDTRRGRGDRAGALQAYERALVLEGVGPWLGRLLNQLASLAEQLGRRGLAREAWERVVRDFWHNPHVAGQAEIRLARLQATDGEAAEAVERLRKLVRDSQFPSIAQQGRYALVEILIAAGEIDEAIEEVRAEERNVPMRVDLLIRIGEALMDQGQMDRAAEVLRETLEQSPENRIAARRLYEVAVERGTVDELVTELLAAAEEPFGDDALRRLADIYSWQGNSQPALTVYDRLLASNPTEPDLLVRAGVAASEAGDLDRAAAWLSEAVRLQPEHRVATQNLGEVYARLGDTEQAMAMFKRSSGYDPKQPDTARDLGRLLSEYSLHHQAVDVYREARNTTGQPYLMAYEMGRAWIGLMDYGQATTEFLAGLTAGSGASQRLVSYELERLARDEVAGQIVTAALDEWVQLPGLTDEQTLAAGRAYLAAGREERGIDVLTRLPAGSGPLVIEVAREAEFTSSSDVAAALYELGLSRELSPLQRAETSLRLARLRLDGGDWQEALRHLEVARTVSDYEADALVLRAELLLTHKRDVPGSRKTLEALATCPSAEESHLRRASWLVADCLFAEGKFDDAEAGYLQLIGEQPDQLVMPPPPPGAQGLWPGMAGHYVPPVGRSGGRASTAWGKFRLAEIALRRGDLSGAAERFTIVTSEYRGSVWANDALEWLAVMRDNLDGEGAAESAYFEAIGAADRGDFVAAESLLSAIAADRGEPLADDAAMLSASILKIRGDWPRAAAAYETAAADFPDSLLAPEALLVAARLYENELPDAEAARRTLQLLVEAYPTSAAADDAREMLATIGVNG